MKKLIIQRLDTSNYLRKVSVLVDAKKIGRVSFAEVVQFEIPEAAKQLSVKLDWAKSKPIKLNPDLSEEVFFVECSSSVANIFVHTDQYLRLYKVKKKDLPTSKQLSEFRRNFRKVAATSSVVIALFAVFFFYTIYVGIVEYAPLWFALSVLAGYNIYRVGKAMRQRMKGQM